MNVMYHAQMPIIEVAVTFVMSENPKLTIWLTSRMVARGPWRGTALFGAAAIALRSMMVVETDTIVPQRNIIC